MNGKNHMKKESVMKKRPVALVVVSGGVATEYSQDAYVRILDVDNIKAGDGPIDLPKGVGFEELVKDAGVEGYATFVEWKDCSHENR